MIAMLSLVAYSCLKFLKYARGRDLAQKHFYIEPVSYQLLPPTDCTGFLLDETKNE